MKNCEASFIVSHATCFPATASNLPQIFPAKKSHPYLIFCLLHVLLPRYFEKIKPAVACFAASHRAIHKNDLAKFDVEYRRLMRMVVGLPADTNSVSPWPDIFHGWNKYYRCCRTTLD